MKTLLMIILLAGMTFTSFGQRYHHGHYRVYHRPYYHHYHRGYYREGYYRGYYPRHRSGVEIDVALPRPHRHHHHWR